MTGPRTEPIIVAFKRADQVESRHRCAFAVVGATTADHGKLRVSAGEDTLIDSDLAALKQRWKSSLTPYY